MGLEGIQTCSHKLSRLACFMESPAEGKADFWSAAFYHSMKGKVFLVCDTPHCVGLVACLGIVGTGAQATAPSMILL